MEINSKRLSLSHISAYLLAMFTLGILILYTIAKFTAIPYAGFVLNPSNGSIIRVFVEDASGAYLQVGDQLIQVGSLRWSDFNANRRLTMFDDQDAGQVVEIIIQRGAREIKIPWEFPGINRDEIINRISGVLIPAYLFWIAGLASILLVRPRDARWLLMSAFYFVTALWLASGSISAWHVWESAILQRMAIWMSVPVYLHFHWEYPEPFRRIFTWIWWSIYLSAVVMAGLEWFQILPKNAYFFGFFLAVIGSVVLLAAHSLYQAKQRHNVRILGISVLLIIAPVVALGITGLQNAFPSFGGLAFLGMPLLPGAYFYMIYRHQVGGLRVRANRIIAMYVFFLLFGTLGVLLIPVIISNVGRPNAIVVGILAFITAAILAVSLFPKFQRIFKERILGIPLAPTHILDTYSDRVTTSLDMKSLTQLLQKDILASLMIRQSALLRADQEQLFTTLFAMGVTEDQCPTANTLPTLLDLAGDYLPAAMDASKIPAWIQLILPLSVDEEVIGVWLWGERDPDDYYSQTEIEVLTTIANQTAIALVNIEQADRLHTLYQANIERTEQERASLARDLHDVVLNQLASLSTGANEQTPPQTLEQYQSLSTHIRQMISGLRPAMLNYGLIPALEEMGDELSERSGGIDIEMDISPTDGRFEPMIEAHLYRIIQQAAENALRHAQASTLRIHGSCGSEGVHLIVEDDGIGFDGSMNFDQLLADKHFGLAGMHERAEIIGGDLRVMSTPGQGTKVKIDWTPSSFFKKVPAAE
ncbi:MAG: hypothetical protein ISS57_15070 [Anaerolineales bacterium]|nr:hypothetical protein [Chloroflexota bacterium]MBL7163920.1 hypothetical protein [Anaerolineales bacterium]